MRSKDLGENNAFLTKVNESLLLKQGFPKNSWISSSTQLGEHLNFDINAEEDFPYNYYFDYLMYRNEVCATKITTFQVVLQSHSYELHYQIKFVQQ